MAEEPPDDFVEFVTAHLSGLQREAVRLTGGSEQADEIYPAVLSDVAGHWRRLRWEGRWQRRDAAAEFLTRRVGTLRHLGWRVSGHCHFQESGHPVSVKATVPSGQGDRFGRSVPAPQRCDQHAGRHPRPEEQQCNSDRSVRPASGSAS